MLSAKIPSHNITVREAADGQIQLRVAHMQGRYGDIAARADNGPCADADRGWLSEPELSAYIADLSAWSAHRERDDLDVLRALFRRGEKLIATEREIAAYATPEHVVAHRKTVSENLAGMIEVLRAKMVSVDEPLISGTDDPVGKQVRNCFHSCRVLFEQVGDEQLARQAQDLGDNVYRHLCYRPYRLSYSRAIEYLRQLERSVDNMLEPCSCVAVLTGTPLT
jgi:hypothetical protein